LVPAFDGGDDPIGIGRPHETLGIGVVFGDEAIDCALQIDQRMERAALSRRRVSLAKYPLIGFVQPGIRAMLVQHAHFTDRSAGSLGVQLIRLLRVC
jgi:hypothetical protein